MKVQIKCPSCDGILFDTTDEPNPHKDLIGTACSSCGHILTDEDIERQIETAAAARLEQLLNSGSI